MLFKQRGWTLDTTAMIASNANPFPYNKVFNLVGWFIYPAWLNIYYNHLYTNVQDGDFRIFFLNIYPELAHKILCEVRTMSNENILIAE